MQPLQRTTGAQRQADSAHMHAAKLRVESRFVDGRWGAQVSAFLTQVNVHSGREFLVAVCTRVAHERERTLSDDGQSMVAASYAMSQFGRALRARIPLLCRVDVNLSACALTRMAMNPGVIASE